MGDHRGSEAGGKGLKKRSDERSQRPGGRPFHRMSVHTWTRIKMRAGPEGQRKDGQRPGRRQVDMDSHREMRVDMSLPLKGEQVDIQIGTGVGEVFFSCCVGDAGWEETRI